MEDTVEQLLRIGELKMTLPPLKPTRWMITLEKETKERTTPEMLSKDELDAMLRNFAVFKHEDPSRNYKISMNKGSGGYARIFLVDELKDRKKTGKQFALKFYMAQDGGTFDDHSV